ncbi:Hsp20/alpha crystallin family protein [Limisphaera sp. 4302-co]|uniref:Hsp20/alpha crystallin family protein n=1 Tax=Limisphaera sp. 4302-co TaxID=3400417 RepID=UPI003C15D972
MSTHEQWQVRLNQVAGDLYQLSVVHMESRRVWHPAINAFRLSDRYLVCVELAGMQKEQIAVRVEPQRLIIEGNRASPEPRCASGDPAPQVLAMEIDYGPFERILRLPEPIRTDQVTARYREGLLWIELPLARPASPGLTVELTP